jgi:hypothetical protein
MFDDLVCTQAIFVGPEQPAKTPKDAVGIEQEGEPA